MPWVVKALEQVKREIIMQINSDFDLRAAVHGAHTQWLESPMKGVFRRPLDRVGAEIARATTIVRYEPNSKFSPHVHTGGEEFFVLEGTFQDEHGDYPAGSYIRNPPGSSHTPGSEPGCVMLVKLWQFLPEDQIHVRLNTNFMNAIPHRDIENVSVIPLFQNAHEEVSIQYWEANSKINIETANGLEVFVIDGEFSDEDDHFESQSWLRLPLSGSLTVQTGSSGAKVWVKQNHLANVADQITRVNHVS